MRRKAKNSTEQSIDDLFQAIDATDTALEKTEENNTEENKSEENEKYDLNGIEVVLERIEAGLIGALLVKDSKINKPLIKDGDYVHLRAYAKLLPKDIIFYKDHDDYFIRRIIKFENDEIWCAGDNERYFRIIHKDNVIAKALGRTRGKKFLSFGLGNSKYRLYANWKSYFNGIRLANRVMTFDEETNSESFELAMQNFEAQQAQQAQTQQAQAQNIQISSDIDLDSELADFLNPDDLVKELQEQEQYEEEVYIDENGNELTKEQYEKMVKEAELNADAMAEESEFSDDVTLESEENKQEDEDKATEEEKSNDSQDLKETTEENTEVYETPDEAKAIETSEPESNRN